jgi:SAM-dependent methyltransferase
MPQIPDLADPRYLDEIGWFLYHEKYRRDQFGGAYDQERVAYSRMFLEEVLGFCDKTHDWLHDKTVVTIGCGCTGDLSVWPAAAKIAVDPLLYVYQLLGILVQDEPGTAPTVQLSVGIENLPLLDACADLVICRNSLDHMRDPEEALKQIDRILKHDGAFFLSVDIGGEPTPDEPTVFSEESLIALLKTYFDMERLVDKKPPHSSGRTSRIRSLLQKRRGAAAATLDKNAILHAYIARLKTE